MRSGGSRHFELLTLSFSGISFSLLAHVVLVPSHAAAQNAPPAASQIGQVSFSEFPLPIPTSYPLRIVSGRDGALWFTESGSVGRITTSGKLQEFRAYPHGGPRGEIVAKSDGTIWYVSGRGISRLDAHGITEFVLEGTPLSLATGSDGALWFINIPPRDDRIGRLTGDGEVSEFTLSAHLGLLPLSAGPDGALWHCMLGKIARITTTGGYSEYRIPTASGVPAAITTGPDGALWFAELNGNRIGRITTSGETTEYALPGPDRRPSDIVTGPDGALWFTESGGNNIGRITISGAISEFAVPTSNSGLAGIATGSDGAIWFTESTGNKIGRLVVTSGP